MPHNVGATLSPKEPSVRVTVNLAAVSATATPSGGSEAPARELSRWLDGHEQLRGRVHLIEGRHDGAAINGTLVSLAADLGPPGLAALGTALVTWLRHRTSDVRMTIRRHDGTRIELSARRVRGMGQAELKELIDQLSARAS